MNFLFIRNSAGKRDVMLSFAVYSFFIMVFCILAPMLNGFHIGSFVWSIEKPDNTLLLGTLGSTLLSYVTRRNTKDKIDSEEIKMQLQNQLKG